MDWPTVAIVVGVIILAAWSLRPRRKLSFETAVLAARTGPLMWDPDYTPATFAGYPSTSLRVQNNQISIIYWKEEGVEHIYEVIDMLIPSIGGGGLNVQFVDGQPIHWGRFGDPPIQTPPPHQGDAQKAKAILSAVKAALNARE